MGECFGVSLCIEQDSFIFLRFVFHEVGADVGAGAGGMGGMFALPLALLYQSSFRGTGQEGH